jgi:dTDP-4-amino-4,6-dideoxygalactose transaminase
VFHQYTIRVLDGRRDAVADGLRQRGIGTGVYYPVPVHHQQPYRAMGYADILPNAERACEEVLSLPVHPGLDACDLDDVVSAVNELCA